MTERTVAQIDQELRETKAQQEQLSALHFRLIKERNALLLSQASHPWIGKQVTKKEGVGYGPNRKTVTRKGTVTAYDPDKHRGLRGIYSYALGAGDPFVLHPAGRTGYFLFSRWGAERGKVDGWELVG